jgi:hypothetical protein
VTDDNHYQIVTAEFIMKGRRPRRRSIVLEKISQSDQLIAELKFRKQKDGLAFAIQESNSPSVQTPEPLPGISQSKPARAPMYLYLTGAFLIMEGLPLLMAGLSSHHDSPDPNMKPNLKGSFGRFIGRHFSSVAEFKHFLLLAGAILCGSGLALIIWSRLLDKKRKQLVNEYAFASQ